MRHTNKDMQRFAVSQHNLGHKLPNKRASRAVFTVELYSLDGTLQRVAVAIIHFTSTAFD
jgi:hypothetical protein